LATYKKTNCFDIAAVPDSNRSAVSVERQVAGVPIPNVDEEEQVEIGTEDIVESVEIFGDVTRSPHRKPEKLDRKIEKLDTFASDDSFARMMKSECGDTLGDLLSTPMHEDALVSKETASVGSLSEISGSSGLPSPTDPVGRRRVSFGKQDVTEISGASGENSLQLKSQASLGLHGVLDWLAKSSPTSGRPQLKKQGSGDTLNSHRSQASAFSMISAKSKTTQALRDSDQCEWWMSNSENASKHRSTDAEAAETHFGFVESWCGKIPDEPETARTPFRDRGVFGLCREYAAGQRHRYQWDGYDLDLAYVTSRVIAMGFPGQGRAAIFRNPLSEVRRFLRDKHGDDFRIYNLCIEKSHSDNGFPEHTVRFPCADHAPPPFATIHDFCTDVESYLREKAENVVAVHCKAGKGRTGTLICSLLIFSKAVKSAYDALRWYELTRGGFRSGVTIPAQIRWIAMFERWMRKKANGLRHDPAAAAVPHRMQSLRLGPFHPESLGLEEGGSKSSTSIVAVRVGLASREDNNVSKVSFWYPEFTYESSDDCLLNIALPQDGPVWIDHDGRLLIRISQKRCCCLAKSKTLKIACWWHTAFLQSDTSQSPLSVGVLDIGKVWVDGLQRDSPKHKKTPEEFRLYASFVDVQR